MSDGNEDQPPERASSAETTPPRERSKVLQRDPQALRTNIGRRAFLRFMSYVTPVATVGAFAIEATRGFVDVQKLFSDKDQHVDMDEMRRVFGIDTAKAGSVLPAANHPSKPPPVGMKWYPNELACADAFNNCFFKNPRKAIERRHLKDHPEDTLYAFGSQVSNFTSSAYLGSPEEEPVPESTSHYCRLRWNLHTPANAEIEVRQQYGGTWPTKKHVIIDFHGQQHNATDDTDYLLVTVLPRYSPNKPQRVFIFGGIHAPGTRAARILFETPSEVIDLLHFLKEVKNFSNPYYYQALFKVSVQKNKLGESNTIGFDTSTTFSIGFGPAQ